MLHIWTRAALLQAFDELLLLKKGGCVIYFGPLGGGAAHLIDHFQDIKGVPHIQEGANPSAWMLEVSRAQEERRLGVDFGDVYQQSELYK